MGREGWRVACLRVLGVSCSRPTSRAADSTQAPPGPSGAPVGEAAPARPLAQGSITNLGPGRFAILSKDTLDLQTKATLERRSADGSWVADDGLDGGQGFRLVETCDAQQAPSAACRQLEG